MRYFTKLQQKLVIIVVSVAIPALIITAYSALKYRKHLENQIQNNVLNIARDAAHIQNHLISNGRDILFTLSKIPQFSQYDSDYCSNLLSDILKETSGFIGFAAYKPDGSMFASAPRVSEPVNISDRPYYKHLLETNSFTVSNFIIGRITGRPTIILAFPVFKEGKLVSILAGGLELQWLHGFVKENELPYGAILCVIDREGVVLFYHQGGERYVGKNMDETPIVKEVLTRKEGTTKEAGFHGEKKLFGFTSFGYESTSGYVIVGIPLRIAFAETNRLILYNTIWLSLIVLCAFFTVQFFGNYFIKNPVERLVEATKKFSEGHLDERTGMDYNKGELGKLAEAVDSMAESLELKESERSRAEEMLKQKVDELSAHSAILNAALLEKKLDEVLNIILDTITGYLGCEYASFHIVEEDRVVLRTWRGFSASFRARVLSFPADDPPDWMKELRVVHEPLNDSNLTPEPFREEGIQAWVSIPILLPERNESTDRWLGTLMAGSRSVEALSGRHIETLGSIANHLALTLGHIKTFHTSEERLYRLQTLRNIDKAIIQKLEIKDVLKVVLEGIPKKLGADVAAISLFNDDKKGTEIFIIHMDNGNYIEEECFSLAESLLQWLIERREPIIIYELNQDPRVQMHRKYIQNCRLSSYMGVPLIAMDKMIGILHIITKEPRIFAAEDVAFFTTLAGQAAIAIENARLFEELKKELQIRRETEKSLRETNELLQHLINSSPTVIYSLKVEGESIIPTWVSSNIASVFGYTREEVLKKNWWIDHVHPEDRKQAEEKSRSIFDKNHVVHEYRILNKDGHTRWIHDDLRLQRDSHGNPIEIIGAWIDITEIKELEEKKRSLEEQLYQSQKMEAIGVLAGGVAHDFNNLLTVIKGYSQLSLMKIKEGDPLRDMIQQINDASDRAAALTQQLLAFSRRQVMEVKIFDLNTLIQNMHKMLPRLIGENIELTIHFAPDPCSIMADPGQIEQVIMNLVVNAKDAMQYGGKLIIETSNVEMDDSFVSTQSNIKTGAFVMLSVSDTGVGMSPEIKERIFEPFFTTKKKGAGTGLGLSTVYGIIKQSGGEILVYSEPGKGTTFKILFPMVEKPAEDLGSEKENSKLPCGNETILVVEDEAGVRSLVFQILTGLGYKVISASNGEEALEICQGLENPIHLVLTDMIMPGMSGIEFVDKLKEVLQDFKVIYMSGYTDSTIAHYGILEKGIDLILKPLSIEKLAWKIRKVLDNQV